MRKSNIFFIVLTAGFVFLFAASCAGTENRAGTENNHSELTEFWVNGNVLYMNNLINSKTPDQLKRIFAENPDIDTLIMQQVDGSLDDTANLQAASWIAKKNLTFILEPDSEIASGGTDFFLAGKKRVIKKGAKVGVHSWADESSTARDFPRGHSFHQPYIDYYIAIGWTKEAAEKFYYFTINAASAEDIHWMTEVELREYNITTE